MSVAEGFPPIYSPQSRVLILGSMPGQASLQAQQYYAYPRNAFWQIMGDLFVFSKDETYKTRTEKLIRKRVALWDVMQTCFRVGSLDSSIDEKTIVANNFEKLFEECPDIKAVFFNGKKAQQAYLTYVLPKLPKREHEISLHILPSTSPAYAAMSYARKYQSWSVILDYLES